MAGWNDISKGMNEANPIIEDEAQMRVFWREWDRRMSGGARETRGGARL